MFRNRFMRYMAPEGGEPGNPPAPPGKSFTQEELDAALEAERKKYADYEELKKSKAELDKLKKSQLSESEKLKKELDDTKAELEKAKGETKAMQLSQLKAKLCAEAGLPAGLSDRLVGEDEASIKKDIENLKKIVDVQPAGGKGTPPNGEKGGQEPRKSGNLLRDAIASYYGNKA